MGKPKKWIGEAIGKPGALSRQLRIPVEENIPISLLTKIKKAKIGSTVKNPTKKGKRKIKVTRKIKKRAVLAHTLKGIMKNRSKKKRKRSKH